MPTSIEALTEADRRRVLDVDNAAFFFDPDEAPEDKVLAHFDWSRTYGATTDGSDSLAGVYTSYDMQVTVPGALGDLRQVPMAGLSWVSVHPDRRRRGVLSAMMRHHFDDLRAQGAALGGLHAAEVAIYGRFGYGTSSLDVVMELARGTTLTAPALDDRAEQVRTWFVPADSDEVAAEVHRLHLRCAQHALGAVARSEKLARPVMTDIPQMRRGREPGQVMFAEVDGRRTGYATFSREAKWENGLPQGTVNVHELQATDPASLLALARRLVDFDLTARTKIGGRGVDDPVLWWTGGPRSVGLKAFDALWLRLVDVGGAMSGRGYAQACDVVMEVVDDFCAWNAGRWRLHVDETGTGVCEPTQDEAELRVPVQALGAAYLGGRSLVGQADAGVVQVQQPLALRALSRAMRGDVEPVGSISF